MASLSFKVLGSKSWSSWARTVPALPLSCIQFSCPALPLSDIFCFYSFLFISRASALKVSPDSCLDHCSSLPAWFLVSRTFLHQTVPQAAASLILFNLLNGLRPSFQLLYTDYRKMSKLHRSYEVRLIWLQLLIPSPFPLVSFPHQMSHCSSSSRAWRGHVR